MEKKETKITKALFIIAAGVFLLVLVFTDFFAFLSGMQGGKFACTGSSTISCKNYPGYFTTIRGIALNEDGEQVGSEKPLLYLLLFYSKSIKTSGSSTSQEDSYLETRHTIKSFMSDREYSFSMVWNRKSDTITINEKRWKRNNGRILVVYFDESFNSSVWQLKDPENKILTTKEIIEYINASPIDQFKEHPVELYESKISH